VGNAPSTVGWRRGLAAVAPLAMPVAMRAVFGATSRRFGAERGYQAGFAVYWAACWTLAGVVVGPRRLRELWQVPDPSLPAPRPLAAAVFVVPPLGALATEWLPNARTAGTAAVAVAAGVGVTNALAEEAFWRGVPAASFPGERLRGWLVPAVAFTAWHLVPLSARPTTAGRRAALLGGAAAIGLGNGWVAQRTGSLALVSAAHAVTDSCGVRTARTTWLSDGPIRPAASTAT
jgi:membrane protease YdiL (CAAX protease family)